MKKSPPVQAKRPPYPVKAANGAAAQPGRSKDAGLREVPERGRIVRVVLACALALAADLRAQARDPDGFAATLKKLRAAARIPGLSAVVVKDGRVILKRGFGFANVEERVPATPETPYNIASVSKPISAVVALRLVQDGKLDLDRLLKTNEKFFGVMSSGWRSRSSRATSVAASSRCGICSRTRSAALRASGSRTTRSCTPGRPARWPRLERSRFPLVEEYVFRPAGTKSSARIHRDLPLRPDLARALAPPYYVDDAGKVVPSPPLSPQGDGAGAGVITTVLDLAKFDIALDAGKLVSSRSRERMMTPVRSSSGAVLPYGLGFFVQTDRDRKLVWHSRWWEKAYSAIYLKVPQKRLTLILLANSEGLWWDNPLDQAQVEKSPFAAAFLEHFSGPRKR